MSNEHLSEIRKKLDLIKTDETAREQMILEEVDASRRALKAAEDEMKKKKEVSDVRGYGRAIIDKHRAQDNINFYTSQLENLKSRPLITRAEYLSTLEKVEAEQRAINAAAQSKIVRLIDEAVEIAKEAEADIADGNHCLMILQVDCFKDPEYLVAIDEFKPFKHKKWSDSTVGDFVDGLKESDFYKNAHRTGSSSGLKKTTL